MLHAAQVFKAARALAPSLVLVDDCEEVFITDKTRAAELAAGGEPPSRIRKALLAEVRGGAVAALGAGLCCGGVALSIRHTLLQYMVLRAVLNAASRTSFFAAAGGAAAGGWGAGGG